MASLHRAAVAQQDPLKILVPVGEALGLLAVFAHSALEGVYGTLGQAVGVGVIGGCEAVVHQRLLQQRLELSLPLAATISNHLNHAAETGEHVLQQSSGCGSGQLVGERYSPTCLEKYSTQTIT
jgi:hypothetical protein